MDALSLVWNAMAIFHKNQESGMSSSSSEGAGDTLIAQGVRVEGDFTSSGNVVIEGEVHGSVATSQHLIVGEHAKIVADVKAATALIAGIIEGNVFVTGRLELKSTSHILGDVVADDLVIESGALLNGRISMKQAEAELATSRRKKGAREEMAVAEAPAEL